MNKRTLPYILLSVGLAAAAYFLYLRGGTDSSQNQYYGYYTDVRGLQESSPILYRGVKVGKVVEIDLNIREKVRVIFSIDKDLRLPQGTAAVISTGDMSGSKSINLEFGRGTPLEPGSTLQASVDSSITESFNARISPIIETGKVLLHSADSALFSFNKFVRQGWGSETRQTLATTNEELERAAKASADAQNSILKATQQIHQLGNLTQNTGAKNRYINQSLTQVEKSASMVAGKNIFGEFKDRRTSISELSANLGKVRRSKALTDSAAYRNASQQLNSFTQATRKYMDAPPTLIDLGPGGTKK